VLVGAAVLLFGLAALPARAVPWSWALDAVENRREELAFLGLGALVASVALLVIA